MWKDAKYLLAYVTPATAFAAVYLGGIWSYLTVFYGFGLMPLLETLTSNQKENLEEEQESSEEKRGFFDWLLYLNVPIVYGLLAYFIYSLQNRPLQTYEWVGMTASVGLIWGACGINVGHELGHRDKRHEQILALLLLLPNLYLHFFIEHNRGHHKHVATPKDPATARYGEVVYLFWFRSVWGSYRHAWELEAQRLRRAGRSPLHWSNLMLWFQAAQLGYLALIYVLGGWALVGIMVVCAVVGFLLLETINYVEHYGLMRRLLPNGQYEKVDMRHSWNSSQILGRIMLYELTRHSDHHYKASRKYQILRHYEQSPQLPFGYPTLVLLSLFPPIWFAIMNPRAQSAMKEQYFVD